MVDDLLPSCGLWSMVDHGCSRSSECRRSDLPRLYRENFSSRAQWKAIGCALGICADDLEAIDRDRRGICEDCFQELLLKWLRKRGEKN